MRLAALTGLVAIAIGFGLAGDAHADPPHKKAEADAAAPKEPTREERIEQAKQLFAAAEEKLSAGDVGAALSGYRASNEMARSPQAMFRIAQCLEKVGSHSEAVESYHRFLGLPPPESMAAEKRLAGERIADLEAGTLKVSSEPMSITMQIDGKPGARTPITIRVPAGVHTVFASAPGYEPATREVEVTRGGTMELAIMLKSVPPPPLPPLVAPVAAAGAAPSSTTYEPTVLSAGIAFGLAAVGVGVGTAFGVRAISAHDDYEKAPSQDLSDKQKNSALIADGSFGAAIVCAIVGAVFATHLGEKPAKIVPLSSTKIQGAAAVFRF